MTHTTQHKYPTSQWQQLYDTQSNESRYSYQQQVHYCFLQGYVDILVNHVEGIRTDTHPVRVKHAPRRRRWPSRTKPGNEIPRGGVVTISFLALQDLDLAAHANQSTKATKIRKEAKGGYGVCPQTIFFLLLIIIIIIRVRWDVAISCSILIIVM